MITALQLQSATIAWMKSNLVIPPVLTEEIREHQWQGNVFVYPNIRVRVGQLITLLRNECDVSGTSVDVLIHSNKPSSLEAETISQAIIVQMNHRRFIYSGIQYISIKASQTSAFRVESEGMWRSIVHLQVVIA